MRLIYMSTVYVFVYTWTKRQRHGRPVWLLTGREMRLQLQQPLKPLQMLSHWGTDAHLGAVCRHAHTIIIIIIVSICWQMNKRHWCSGNQIYTEEQKSIISLTEITLISINKLFFCLRLAVPTQALLFYVTLPHSPHPHTIFFFKGKHSTHNKQIPLTSWHYKDHNGMSAWFCTTTAMH